jgi:glutamate--cysteine ligase
MFGICMMRASCSTQVAIDYTSVDDCLRKLRLTNAAVPALALICDNTPVFEAAPRPHKLMRTELWDKCDPDRCNTVPGVMDAEFSLEAYAEYILDTPALVDVSSGTARLSEKTFGEIYANTQMTRADIEHALSMFFTDVRLKTYIEIRPADAMPLDCVIAYAALNKGLFMNAASLDALDVLFAGVTAADIAQAKDSLMENGYNGQIYGHPAAEIVDEMFSIARAGLTPEEQPYLDPLANLAAHRTTLADIAEAQISE